MFQTRECDFLYPEVRHQYSEVRRLILGSAMLSRLFPQPNKSPVFVCNQADRGYLYSEVR